MRSAIEIRAISCKARAGRGGQKAFTLIELVMVIVLLGILAVFAVPRITDMSVFNAKGFHDGTLAYLRYAQKTAIAQRRTVCVSFTSGSITLTMASAAGANDCNSATALTGPNGDTPASLVAASGVNYSSTPPAFNFSGLGQPIDGSGTVLGTQTLQVSGVSNAITVEANTGYVHD